MAPLNLLSTKIIAGLLFINLTCQFAVDAGDLTSKFKKCKEKDANFQNCFKDSVTKAMEFIVKGSREFNIVPMDPLHIPRMEINEPNQSDNYGFSFENCDFFGLKEMKILSAKAVPENNSYDIDLKLPFNIISGLYEVNGRILLLPIKGNGNINLTCDEPHLNWKFQVKPVTKDGKTSCDVESFELTTKVTTGSVYLTNLFGGNAHLGDAMNKFLNENFQEVLETVLPHFDNAMSKVLKGLAKRIFNQLSSCDFFQ